MTVLVKKSPPAGMIVLNRPDKRNAISRQMLADITQALDDLHQERAVRAVILTGAGPAFCAGMDLAEMHATAQQPQADAWQQWHQDAVQYRELLDKLMQYPKPIIAAANGPVVAGGAGLLLASDLVVASAEAKFGLPEPRRGIVAGMVAPLLVFRIGASYAANLLLTARMVEANEAARMALYHEIVPGERLLSRAHELAEEVARSAPEAIQLTKKLLNETIGEHLGTLLSAGAAASAAARTTEAAAEGLAAFLEKRDPNWL
jgi:enoyl-CoA hydratase/carnithine racemase